MQVNVINEVEVGGKFSNLDSYNQNMAKGLVDKLFFVDKLPLRKYDEWVFVDFGCADGVLINALSTILPKYGVKATLVGFDISETMIDLASSKYGNCSSPEIEIVFTASWQDVLSCFKANDEAMRVLICNSVIHEVYSYANDQSDIDWFWRRVKYSGFDFVCVRDMMAERSIQRATDSSILESFYDHVQSSKPELIPYIKDFERHWGSLEENENFIHYLLKYRWTTNWSREVNENYFPIMVENFLTQMSGFNRMYFERFRLPFLEGCWLEDFGVKLKDNTHIKAIFAKDYR